MIARLIKGLFVIFVVALVVIGGIGWYFASKAEAIDHQPNYSVTLEQATAKTVTLQRTHDDVLPGVYGIDWLGGRATVGKVVNRQSTSVTRELISGEPPPVGTKVEWNTEVYAGNPLAVGLSFQDVQVATAIGNMPAWYVPATKSTWAIVVHGHDADRTTGLRVMPTLHQDGFPVLDISYRNDVGAPSGPDHKEHLGGSEWHDVDSAITYAKDHGATSVVLYGYSQGGSMVLETARHSSNASMVKGIILDSPVIDWRSTLDAQGASFDLPLFETRLAEGIFSRRTGFDFNDMDQLRHAHDFKVPMLLFYGAQDNYVPTAPDAAFAKARPDLVSLVETPNATHVGGWNVDSAAYDSRVTTFLNQ